MPDSPLAAGLLARIPGTDDAMQVVTSEAARQATEARAGSSRPDFFHGLLRITWPAPSKDGRPLTNWQMTLSALIYAEDGTVRHDGPILTARKVTVHADPDSFVWAELEMHTTPDGKMLTGTEQHPDRPGSVILYPREDGNGVLTGTFAFLVTSMETRQP